MSRGVWGEVVCLPTRRQHSGLCAVGGHECASEMAFPALATGTYVPMTGPKVSPRVRGPLPPFLLWSSFSPNSLDSQSFGVQAGHWAADASKAGQDGASGSPQSPRGVGQDPFPLGLVARASHLALECW